MSNRTELTELELRILLAVDETRGDLWKIKDELNRGGLPKNQMDDVTKALKTLCRRRKFVEQADGESYRLTEVGRGAARQTIERLQRLLDYATKTLR